MNTRFTMLLSLVSAVALAQNISGTMSAVWDGDAGPPVATTHVELHLQCGLTCPPSAPQMKYAVSGLVHSYYEASPMEAPGSLGFGFATGVADTGVSTADTTTFPWGSNFHLVAKSANCVCGNGALQSAFIDVVSNTVSIAPKIQPPLSNPYTLGVNPKPMVIVTAAPRGGETVTVTATGAGLALNQTITSTDWRGTSTSTGSNVKLFELAPTDPGTVTFTAQVTGTPSSTITFAVVGGNTGGGTGNTGGGSASGGGGGAATDGGCSAVGLSPFVAFALAGLLRRRQRR